MKPCQSMSASPASYTLSLCLPLAHLQTITPIGLAINHIQYFLFYLPAHAVSGRPIVSRARALFVDVEVLGVVDVAVRALTDTIDDARFKVEHDGAWDVASVVGLVEEDIFAVAAFGGIAGEVARLVDAVLLTKALPEL